MAKMADLAHDPTKEENAAEEAPQPNSQYRSSANLHHGDMEEMGMKNPAPGDHVEGRIHGVVSHSHEGGMMMHITHGGLKKVSAKKSDAEKMYGKEEHREPDGDEK